MDYLDIFYNYIVKEAAKGKISCFLDYGIIFETEILETGEKVSCMGDYYGVLVPILTIHDKKKFDELLCRYVNLCLSFYDRKNFRDEVFNKEEYEINRTSPEKMIMTFLWANATFDDFLNPEDYLEKRIAFLEMEEESFVTGVSSLLKGKINFKIQKDFIVYETPFKISISSVGVDNGIYKFPEIRFGIYNDTVYFYTIQNPPKDYNMYNKYVNRALYKVNSGFVDDESGIKDISPSFVVSLNMAINYFYSLGFRKIDVSSMLISRWNAKKVILNNKYRNNMISDEDAMEELDNQDKLQHNLTEKFLNTFLRLVSQYEGIEVVNLPYDIDTSMHLELGDEISTSNELLRETGDLIKSVKNVKKL